jgi:xylulokinase
MSYTLGIDLGTQSVKVLIYDSNNKQTLAVAGATLDLIAREDGTREQEARWWVEGLKKALKSLDQNLLSQVAAVGVSGQQHGFVPLAADGSVLYPVKLWCDTATAGECEEITLSYGGVDELINHSGNPILPGYTASKILWLKKFHPQVFAKLDTILLPHDYVNFLLTGNRVMEAGDASGTGLLDVRTKTWNIKLAHTIDPKISQCLPKLIQSWESAGKVTAQAFADFGIPQGIPVSAGGGDNMMGAIGTGAVRPGAITASMGTSGTLYTATDQPIVDPLGEIAAFCSSTDSWLPLLCTMNCTIATEKARDQFGISLEELNTLAAKATAGSGGVVTLPFYNGERTPNLPSARAAVLGMTYENGTKENILRSAMESGVYGLKFGLQRFAELGIKAESVTLIGGGAKSLLWSQMAADIFELPVRIPEIPEAAAFGAALQALWCLETGQTNPSSVQAKMAVESLVETHVWSQRFTQLNPNPDTFGNYRKTYGEYQRYLKALSHLYK